MSKMFMVFERAEEFEQGLVLRTGDRFPPGGILDWAKDDKEPRALFPDRKAARDAIYRTEHYRLAFAATKEHWPERQFCVVVPVAASEPEAREGEG